MDHKGLASFVVIALAMFCEVSEGARFHLSRQPESIGWKPWMNQMFGQGRMFRTSGFGSPWSSKRSVSTTGKRFEIMVNIDMCHFDTYDIDGDGFISLAEMRIIFFDDKTGDDLFKALDRTTGDDRVTKDEFQYMAPRIITNCETTKL